MNEVTRILTALQQGEPSRAGELLPLVYDELRTLAAQRLGQERPGQTLQATALVHEAYLRLLGAEAAQRWDGRGHFFAAAAEAMRRILVDRARHRLSLKAGGDRRRLDLAQIDLAAADGGNEAEFLALDDALKELEQHDPQASQLVKLRYFGGLTHQEAAEAMGVTRRVADRLWALARAWLYRHITSH